MLRPLSNATVYMIFLLLLLCVRRTPRTRLLFIVSTRIRLRAANYG